MNKQAAIAGKSLRQERVRACSRASAVADIILPACIVNTTCNMFAIIKCFHVNKKKRISSDELYGLNLDTYHYWPFKPTSATAFDKRVYYGRIDGDFMLLNYIIFLSGKLFYLYHVLIV